MFTSTPLALITIKKQFIDAFDTLLPQERKTFASQVITELCVFCNTDAVPSAEKKEISKKRKRESSPVRAPSPVEEPNAEEAGNLHRGRSLDLLIPDINALQEQLITGLRKLPQSTQSTFALQLIDELHFFCLPNPAPTDEEKVSSTHEEKRTPKKPKLLAVSPFKTPLAAVSIMRPPSPPPMPEPRHDSLSPSLPAVRSAPMEKLNSEDMEDLNRGRSLSGSGS